MATLRCLATASLAYLAYKSSDREYALIDEDNVTKVPQSDHATWQALVKAWIFAVEKAKRGIPIHDHVTLTLNLVENGTKTDIHHELSSDDEMVYQIDGVDWREILVKYSL
ncbi:MAG: hypothetical protein ACXV5H_12050 [Halobacteriota archaeon]